MDDWEQVKDKQLTKTFVFESFNQALSFVNKVGALAEKVNHHPDITINHKKVTLTLSTHDVGKITNKDLDLAKKIDELL